MPTESRDIYLDETIMTFAKDSQKVNGKGVHHSDLR